MAKKKPNTVETDWPSHTLFEQAAVGMVFCDLDANFLRVNRRFCEICGYSEAKLLGQNIAKITHEDDRVADLALIGEIRAGKRDHYALEKRYVHEQGHIVWVRLTVTLARDGAGKAQYFIGIVENITEYVRADESLRLNEQKLKEAQSLAKVGSWELDLETDMLTWSDEEYRIFGIDRDHAGSLSEAFYGAVHPDDREHVRQIEHGLGASEESFEISFRLLTKDGSLRHVTERGRLERDANGRIKRLVGTTQDVTDRIRIETALRESEALLAAGQRLAKIGTWEWQIDPDRQIWSEELWRMHGLTPGKEPPNYRQLLELIHPEDRERMEQTIRAALTDAAEYELRYRIMTPQGSIKLLREIAMVERDEQNRPKRVYGTTQDITELTRAEQQLRLSETRFREAQRIARIGSWELDLVGGALTWSDEIFRLFEIDQDKFGASYEAFLDAIHPDDRAAVNKAYTESLVNKSPYEITHRLLMKDGRVKYVVEHCKTEFDLEGKPLRSIGTVQDITERKQAELALREAKEAAEEANRAKSEFLSNMSHELRTPMNAILGFAQLLEADRRDPLTPAQVSYVRDIMAGGGHLLSLINDILELSKIDAGHLNLSFADVALHEVVADTLPLVRDMSERRNIVVSAIDNTSPSLHVRADTVRLKQVLLNLLSNAVKYNRDGGSVAVKCERGPAGYLRVSVADTGRGIAPERQKELFQSFNRLGAEGSGIEGTGIGLALTKRLVELMGGRIGFESKLNKGSTFWIELPAAERSTVERAPAKSQNDRAEFPSASSGRNILYVEDNPANVRLMEGIVGQFDGVHLTSVHTGELGLEIARQKHPDLILMDIQLPGLDGIATMKKLRQDITTRDIPVIAISANAMPHDLERARAAGFGDYLTKPVSVPKLMAALNKYLGGLH